MRYTPQQISNPTFVEQVYTVYTKSLRESSMLTRIFKSGNSLAVRIPKELAFDSSVQEVEIERKGNSLLIRPVENQTLAGLADVFAMFSADFMSEGRDAHEQKERDWNPT